MTDHEMSEATGSVPVPDPTKLTTDAVRASESRTDAKLNDLRELLELRISNVNTDAMTAKQTAFTGDEKLQEELDRRLVNLEKLRLSELKNIHDGMEDLRGALEDERRCERDITDAGIKSLDRSISDLNDSVLQRFQSLEDRTAEQKSDNTKAIDKAEGATQKAIEKAEQNTSERVSSIDSKISALSDTFDRQIRDLKEQVDRGDRGGQGVGQDFAEARAERAADDRRAEAAEKRAEAEVAKARFYRVATVVGSIAMIALAVAAAVRIGA